MHCHRVTLQIENKKNPCFRDCLQACIILYVVIMRCYICIRVNKIKASFLKELDRNNIDFHFILKCSKKKNCHGFCVLYINLVS